MDQLRAENASGEDAAELTIKAVDLAADRLFASISRLAPGQCAELQEQEAAFSARNVARWGAALCWLKLHRQFCIECGQRFQEEFLAHEAYHHDPLLGVLMRLHAHGCRIQGEVITLLAAGYPDGAFARWRTLHEIAVAAIILRENGTSAAEDYIQFGMVQAIKGMNGFQETASAMKRAAYSDEEIDGANQLADRIKRSADIDFKSRNGWAKKYVGGTRFLKLQEAAGLGHWRNDYALASRDVHTDFREMRSLLAMSGENNDLLLCGPSGSVVAEPAHSAAISLAQATIAFILARDGDSNCPIDFTGSLISAKVLDRLTETIGSVLEAQHHETAR